MATAVAVPRPQPMTDDRFERLASEFLDWLETVPEPFRWREDPDVIKMVFMAEKIRRELT